MKKMVSFLLAFVFLLITASLPASAIEVNGQTVIFTIINNDLAPLRSDTMPVIIDNSLFVPYTVFSSNFDIGSINNTRDELLILSDLTKTLFFDMKNGECYDREKQTYSYSAFYKNGLIYVPAAFVSRTFGLVCSYYSDVSTVRIKDINSSYSDKFLLTVFAEKRQNALEEYENNSRLASDPVFVPFDTYFAFFGSLGDQTENILDVLDEIGQKAAFFVAEEDILKNEDLIRRIYVSGHTIGLTVSDPLPEDADQLILRLDETQDMLDRVLNVRSRLVSFPGGFKSNASVDEYREALHLGGYRYWDITMRRLETETSVSNTKMYDEICEELLDTLTNTVIGFGYCDQITAVLPDVFKFLSDHECHILLIDELSQPINFHADIW